MFLIINIVQSNMNTNKAFNFIFVKKVFTHFFINYPLICPSIHPWRIHAQQLYWLISVCILSQTTRVTQYVYQKKVACGVFLHCSM